MKNVRWMWPIALALVLMPDARGQEKTGRLILLRKTVDVRSLENLALARLSFRVKNPTTEPMEGTILIEGPAGAAACEVTLLKNIAPDERRSKLMDPTVAERLYERVKRGDTTADEDKIVNAFLDSAGVRADRSTRSEDPVYLMLRRLLTNARAAGSRPGAQAARQVGTPGSPTAGSTQRRDTNASDAASAVRAANPTPPNDPAILELVHGDTYRLRFWPVLAHDDQVVTVLFAWELPMNEDGVRVVVPLPDTSDMDAAAGLQAQVTVAIQSSGTVKALEASHPMQRLDVSTGTRLVARGAMKTNDTEFRISAMLGSEAQPFDLTREVDWDLVKGGVPATGIGFPQAERAVLARTAVSQLALIGTDAADDAVEDISRIANIVSSKATLIAIERRMIDKYRTAEPKEPKKDATPAEFESLPEPAPARGNAWVVAVPITEAEGQRCDFVRRQLEMRALLRQYPCEEYIFTTSDADKIAWAREKGLKWWTTKQLIGQVSYVYVKHSKFCALTDASPARLKELAASLDK